MRFQAAINGLKQALNTLSMSFTSEDFIDQPMASHWALNSKIGLEQIEKYKNPVFSINFEDREAKLKI